MPYNPGMNDYKYYKVTLVGWESRHEAEAACRSVSRTLVVAAKSERDAADLHYRAFDQARRKSGLYDFVVDGVEQVESPIFV